MSIVSAIHTITKLTKESKPLDGQRLIRMIAKGENKHANLMESLCVSVPRVTQDEVADVIDRLLPHVVGLVQDAQDKMAREFRIEHGRDELPQDAIAMDAVIQWLDANAAGDRVTAEYLSEWFAQEYQSAAQAYIAQAMQIDMTPDNVPDVVVQKYNILRDMFTGWASPKYSPPIPKLRAMLKFIESVNGIDGRMMGIQSRASAMLQKKEAELAEDSLGF